MDNSEKQKYRSNFGATILFSFVQVFQILITVIRSKFVALLIGPAGMGISSLLNSTTNLVSACTNLGLKTSGVKTVSAANRENDRDTIAKTVAVLRRLIICTGLIGLIVCAALSPMWSRTSFGNSDYIWSFIIVSFVVLFKQLNDGELVLLQGMQQQKTLAKANVIGQSLSLILTIPLYYLFGVKAIAWVLAISSLLTFCITRFFSHKLDFPNSSVTWNETFSIGWDMIKLGFFLSLQFLMSTAAIYVMRNFVSNWGSLDDVGLYSAGTAIIDTYLGLVFTAIATDYFPRLAATQNNLEMNEAVKRQAELSMLLLAPIVVAFIVFIKPVIVLLYSEKFLPVEMMLYWGMSATIIKALGWSLSYTVLAKGKPLYFFYNELGTMCYSLPIKIFAYKMWGLTGFGIAILMTYVLYLIQMLIVTRRLFGTRVDATIWKICGVSCLPIVAIFLLKMTCGVVLCYVFGGILLALTFIYSFVELNKRTDIMGLVKSKFYKK